MEQFDTAISFIIQGIQVPGVWNLMVLVSALGDVPWFQILIVGVCGFLVLKRLYKEAMLLGLAMIFEGVLNTFLKHLFHRARPESSAEIFQKLSDYSFPSGHTFSFTVFFGLCAIFAVKHVKKVWLRNLIVGVCLTLILLVGLSRIYLGAHYPSDVVGGYGLGLVVVCFIFLILNRK